jgi:hypothetical protein
MEASAKTKSGNGKWERVVYAVFLLAGIYFLLKPDYGTAVVFWGLAPVFDPFDAKIAFVKRPLYQRIWLIMHVAITMVIFVLLITNNR